MKRFTLSVLVTTVFGLAAYSLVDAQGVRRGFRNDDGGAPALFQERGRAGGLGGPGRGFGRGGLIFGLRGLELTDEQKAQIRAIHDEARETQQGSPEQRGLHRQLQVELFSDTPDAAKIAAMQQQLLQAQAARLAQQIAIEQKVAQVLTAEQRAQLRERLVQGPPIR